MVVTIFAVITDFAGAALSTTAAAAAVACEASAASVTSTILLLDRAQITQLVIDTSVLIQKRAFRFKSRDRSQQGCVTSAFAFGLFLVAAGNRCDGIGLEYLYTTW